MMSMRLQIVIIVVMLLAAGFIVNLVRKKKIDFKYALGWLVLFFCILVLSIWPILLNKLAKLLGIASPVNMLFFFGFCFAVAIIFALSLSVSRLEDRVRKLSQEIAIIQKDMYDHYNGLKQEMEKKDSSEQEKL
ncbi:MAG: DUF2304 domain-containing protein [Clostridiaceae bacterium]|nr:DUF2304 domain-containing protein [Clostridiaceae bacterium]